MPSLRESARGQDCQLRLMGICNHNPETTVLAHIRRGGNSGVGMKPADISGVIACSACHDCLDGRAGKVRAHDSDILEGMLRTHAIWRKMGLMK